MYINRKDALDILKKLSREPHYQHDGEDYYNGIAEASGEIYSMPSIGMGDILKEIADKIRAVMDDDFYKDEDQYYRAGIDEGVNRAIEIITEYYYGLE